jgi:hypothetical protein
LIGDGHCFGSARDLEVVTPTAQIDDSGIVSVLQNANEHSLVEALAVAPEDFPSALPHVAGACGIVVVGGECFDGTTNEIERLVSR